MSERHFYITIEGTLWSVLGGGFPEDNHFLIAHPVEEHSNWTRTKCTSPSGRSVFRCKTCERTSVTPDKHCPVGKTISLTELLVVEPIEFLGDNDVPPE